MRTTHDIRNVKLEFLRPGPAHNQLLSPLTPYVAVCGDDGSVTVNMPFEHRELLVRLRRLRYENGVDPAQDIQRQAEVRSMGEEIGKIIGQVPSLLSALCGAGNELVHLRLVLSPSELGMVPFEMAISPNAFPGSGTALFLQPCAPITVTREVRRSTPLKVEWNRRPRILFAFASPPGYAPVPAQDHLNALRRAIEPWVDIVDPDQPEQRLDKVRAHLTVLPDATLEAIRQACAETDYTHVHILAHGDAYQDAGDNRFGVALAGTLDPTRADIVDGTRLAIALTAARSNGATPAVPTFVSLATCDSGNIESVLTPGGSIAHALHMAGIPWVVASQFPLWMRASTMATEILYGGILTGNDPRRVLFDLRQRLRANAPSTHDWASIVAYASVPWGFQDDVQRFRYQQTKRRAEVQFARIDSFVKRLDERSVAGLSADVAAEIRLREANIRQIIAGWQKEAQTSDCAATASELLGMGGALEKRIALNRLILSGANRSGDDLVVVREAFARSRDAYRTAVRRNPNSHWALTQYLSLEAIRDDDAGEARTRRLAALAPWWTAAMQIAGWQYDATGGGHPQDRIWAIGTQLELLALGRLFAPPAPDCAAGVVEQARGLAAELVRLVSAGTDSFPLDSTVRQFGRYRRFWRNAVWDDLIEAILEALGQPPAPAQAAQ